MVFTIKGLICEEESGAGIGGLVVKAVDRDLLFDDLLGSTVTDAGGRFEISYEEEDFRELFENRPDIIVSVKTADRKRLLYTSKQPVRCRAGEAAHFDIKIPSRLLNQPTAEEEEHMDKQMEIGKITLQIDPGQLQRIVRHGLLEAFIEKATTLFNRDLKAELVAESVSSVGTSLLLFDDDEFGTGPRPPHWWNIGKIDAIAQRLDVIEMAVGLKMEDIAEAGQLGVKSR
jgi:hypothetical protein